LIRFICERIHVRPADIWDQDSELTPLERIYIDYYTLTCRSELGSKTMSPEKAKQYMDSLERQKTLLKFKEQQKKKGLE